MGTPMNSGPEPVKRVLVVEDSDASRRLLGHTLLLEAEQILEASDGPQGLKLARECLPELILLDLNLPGWDGYETLRRLKDDPETRRIPVIFLTAEANPTAKAKGLDMGAVDYVSKPFDPVELRARVRAAVRIKRAQDLLEQKAHRDGLTGLGNRHALEERLASDWVQSQRRGSPLAILMADLDRFKAVNDRLGHAAGDAILQGTALALQTAVRGCDFVARYGGEEFVVVAPDCDVTGAIAIAERFRRALNLMGEPYNPGALSLTSSVGVAGSEDPTIVRPEDLLLEADAALYRAKANGRDAVYVCEGGRYLPAIETTPQSGSSYELRWVGRA